MGGDSGATQAEGDGAAWTVFSLESLTAASSRAPDFEAESRILMSLAEVMAKTPPDILRTLAEGVIELCGAGSSVLTFLEYSEDGSPFARWRSAVGALSGREGARDPAHLGPCCFVIAADAPLLCRPRDKLPDDAIHFDPPIHEALLAPFHVNGQAAGAIWAVSHDPDRHFDAEDARRLTSVARFTATAYQAMTAQAELRASEARFRAMVTCPGPVVFRTSVEGEILDAPGWEALTGQPPAKHLGWGWLDAVHPDDLKGTVASWSRSLETGEPTYMDYRLRDTEGRWRWVSGYGAPVRDEGGRIVEWMGTVSDIHQRREAEARRQAIIDLADQIREMDQPRAIARVAAKRIGLTLDVAWVAVGALDEVGQTIAVEESWTRPGGAPVPKTLFFPSHGVDRRAIDQGEPVVVRETETLDRSHARIGASVIYRPLTARKGPQWLILVKDDAPRTWSSDELAFLREAAERTRGAVDRLAAERELRDLTQWLEKEVETRTAEWSRVWRNSRDLLLVMSRDGILRAANPAWTAVLGWSVEDVVGRAFLDLAHPDDRTGARAALDIVADAGSPTFEVRFRRPNGTYGWLSWSAALEDDLIYATARHITAEKEAAAALEETQTRLRTFFETSYQYRALVSLEGELLEANATALEAIGARREDVVGVPLWRTPWFARTPGIPEAVRTATPLVAAGEVRREDIYLNLPAHRWRWLDFTLRPLRDSRGDPVAILLEAVDITERRETEAALRQSQKLEAMGQLTGGVAHDFNNLLTPIIGGLDLLHRRGLGGEREQRLIDGALQSAERAKTLVQRLLAFARRQPLQTGPVEVGTLIAGMTDLVASTSGPTIQVSAAIDADLPPAQADANQLEMAILNLSVNARDAMPEGGKLALSATRARVAQGERGPVKAGDYIRLSVADTGQGMDEETLARAIEPFFSTKGQGRGTGLGLSMAHGLASQLGGALTIASQPGLGTVVDLWLPVSAERPRPMAAAAVPPQARAKAGVALLVDDEAPARVSTAVMLSDLGYEVLEAASAREALAVADSDQRIDLLITDHLMPGMSGADLAGAFRARRPGTTVLIVTGYAESLPGDMPHLSKPFRQSELAARLAALEPHVGADHP